MDFNIVLKEHWGMITRIVSSYEANQAVAQEVEQEVALAIWQALPQFKGQSGLRTYVARICQNRCISHVVKESRKPRTRSLNGGLKGDLDGGFACPQPTPEAQTIEGDKRQRLLAALYHLPVIQRQVITLALEGFSNKDIGETLGISANNAGVRLLRAKAHLKEVLGQNND